MKKNTRRETTTPVRIGREALEAIRGGMKGGQDGMALSADALKAVSGGKVMHGNPKISS